MLVPYHIEAETKWPPFRRWHFHMHFLECKGMNFNSISLKFVPRGQINNTPALVQIMAWLQPGDNPLPEPMMFSLLTHICVTRPQCVKHTGTKVGHLCACSHGTRPSAGTVLTNESAIHVPSSKFPWLLWFHIVFVYNMTSFKISSIQGRVKPIQWSGCLGDINIFQDVGKNPVRYQSAISV